MTDTPSYSCQKVVEDVTEYFEGALDAPERLAFERHVAICPPCRGYLAQLRHVSRVAGTLSEDDVPERLRTSLLEAFRDWRGEKKEP